MAKREMVCGNCRFAQLVGNALFCHLFPPVHRTTPPYQKTWTDADWEFPLMRRDNWCGQWINPVRE
jgi:hypothetical protein